MFVFSRRSHIRGVRMARTGCAIFSFKLSTLHTLHSLHSTLHTPNSTIHTWLYASHSTLGTPHFTLDTPHLDTPHFTLYTCHSTLHTSHSTLYTRHPHSTLYTPHFTLHDSTLYTPPFAFHTHTLHSILCTPHLTLHIPHTTLYTDTAVLFSLYSTLDALHFTPALPKEKRRDSRQYMWELENEHFVRDLLQFGRFDNFEEDRACSSLHKHGRTIGKPEAQKGTRGSLKNEHFVRDLLQFWHFDNFEKERFYSFPQRHGETKHFQWHLGRRMFCSFLHGQLERSFPRIFIAFHKMPRLPRCYHFVTTSRNLADAIRRKHATRHIWNAALATRNEDRHVQSAAPGTKNVPHVLKT